MRSVLIRVPLVVLIVALALPADGWAGPPVSANSDPESSAAPRAATWRPEPAPTVTARQGQLQVVSCVSPEWCMAAGTSGSSLASAQLWDGSGWTASSLPAPADGWGSSPSGISCASETSCVIADSDSKGQVERPLLRRWDGQAWTLMPRPALADGRISDVECPDVQWCVAVGVDRQRSRPAAAVWTGTAWSLMTLPSMPGANLEAVSCPVVGQCVAVGYGDGPPSAVRLSGGSWTRMSLPAERGYLDSVACPTVDVCVASGRQRPSSGILTWSGGAWSAAAVPASEDVIWHAVSCASATACTAVGSGDGGVAATLSDGSWTTSALPTATNEWIDDVECVSAGWCLSVGARRAWPSNSSVAKIWDGTAWTSRSPSDLQVLLSTEMRGVSCQSRSFCVAVGRYANGVLPLVAVRRASVWSAVTPEGAFRADGFPADEDLQMLNDVSCPSPTMCVAVGQTRLNAAAAMWDGTTWRWSLVRVPNRGVAYNELSSVVCMTATYCVAVGSTQPKAGALQGLVATWDGRTWTLAKSPAVSAYTSVSCYAKKACAVTERYGRKQSVHLWNGHRISSSSAISATSPKGLGDLSCTSSRWCAATSAKHGIVIWNGRTWKPAKLAKAVATAQLTSVSCWGRGKCVAVGRLRGGKPGRMVVRSSAKGWRSATVQSGVAPSSLAGVSCTKAASCVAVGSAAAGTRAVVLAG